MAARRTRSVNAVAWSAALAAVSATAMATGTTGPAAAVSPPATARPAISTPVTTPTVDAQASTDQPRASTTVASPTVTTSGAGRLIVAYVEADGPSRPTQQVTAVTGGGLTWTMAVRSNATWGTTEVWSAYASGAFSSPVTATLKMKYDASITVVAYAHANPAPTATGAGSGVGGSSSVTVTPTASGSLVVAAAHNWSIDRTPVPGQGQTLAHDYGDSRVHDEYWVQAAAPTTAAGAPGAVTLTDQLPAKSRWTMAAVEISSPAPADPGAYTPPPVAFGPCFSSRLIAAGAQCGMVTVPLDYTYPTGATIQLAISRVKHKTPDTQYQGVMLVNPGGPGGSGLGLSTLQSRVPNGAGNGYDWIGFDPRGVGSSVPTVSCDPSYMGYDRPYYIPDTPDDEAAWKTKADGYTANCAAKNSAFLPHLRTVDSVYDMNSIRKALGVPQISYYGFSYGTYLGSVYATLFPATVRRMVFDGVVDPTRVWQGANYDQDVAFERTLNVFFTWVARYDSVYHLGDTEAAVEQTYYTQYEQLRTAPAGGVIGSSEWHDIFLNAGYYVFDYEDVASAFSTWVNQGDDSGLLALYPAPTDDNGYAIYLSTQCTDAPWSSYQQFISDNRAHYATAPFETWGNAWFNEPCTGWPVAASQPVTVDGSQVPPILLVSETLDAATPFSGALKARSLFPQSRLVEGVGGTTHAGTLQSSACENNVVASYLADGTLPARVAGGRSDVQCQPNPQPVPTGAAAPSHRSAHPASGTPPTLPLQLPLRIPTAALAR